MNTQTCSLSLNDSTAPSASSAEVLSDESLQDISAGLWPVVGGIVLLGVMGATALWGHKRPPLINL